MYNSHPTHHLMLSSAKPHSPAKIPANKWVLCFIFLLCVVVRVNWTTQRPSVLLKAARETFRNISHLLQRSPISDFCPSKSHWCVRRLLRPSVLCLLLGSFCSDPSEASQGLIYICCIFEEKYKKQGSCCRKTFLYTNTVMRWNSWHRNGPVLYRRHCFSCILFFHCDTFML